MKCAAATVTLAFAAEVFLGGCKSSSTEKSAPPPAQTKPATPMTQANNDSMRQADLKGELTPGSEKYSGPPVKVNVIQAKSLPVQYSAAIEVTVPTGGWTLALDRGEVVDGTARVYLTLEKPADGELVTQALERHSQVYTSPTPFGRAVVYVHVAKRDVMTLTTNYRLAATSD